MPLAPSCSAFGAAGAFSAEGAFSVVVAMSEGGVRNECQCDEGARRVEASAGSAVGAFRCRERREDFTSAFQCHELFAP